MTEGEVSALLLGQLGLLVAISLPFGFAAGWGLCWVMVQGFQSELFRIPDPADHRHLCVRRADRARRQRGLRAAGAPAHRAAGPDRRTEDPRVRIAR